MAATPVDKARGAAANVAAETTAATSDAASAVVHGTAAESNEASLEEAVKRTLDDLVAEGLERNDHG